MMEKEKAKGKEGGGRERGEGGGEEEGVEGGENVGAVILGEK